MKLNGWKRIGIVASVAWFLGAGGCTLIVRRDQDLRFAVALEDSCTKFFVGADRTNYLKQCMKQRDDYLASMSKDVWLNAVAVATVPVPLGWGFVYLTLLLVHWIKRGFADE